ncbi:N-acetylglutamate kinase [Pedobacter psychrotolerans]|uniref:Acetylglutamate kinase n=1 Tax=Pedobacter psychrotolerans TaxID=1843235 RepID=A0A4R2HJF8_9SPHI|nr:acetylglutamate kinase [Pedobacter psychrotolerans]TCO29217.1 N-acetylglutamate kinase [Pedobacter psychrotolerans]GGE55075.1 acetylglutamate kinase [Pedobacter psychrotolerans]
MNNKQLTIIKIGGNVIDNSANLHQFLLDFTALPGDKILVHGGGKIATELGESLGVEAKMVDGRRITDIETLRIVTMVYAGLINKNMVAQLQAKGSNAIGLTGADGNIIKAKKRPIIKFSPSGGDLEGTEIDYGFVGDLDENSVSAETLDRLLQAGLVPVLCAITHDGETQLLNTNADTIASSVAVAMSALYETRLVYCFEKKGVLKDVNDDDSVVREIKANEFEGLKEDGTVQGGMIPKLHNAFEAIKKGVSAVYIGKADELMELGSGAFGTKMLK